MALNPFDTPLPGTDTGSQRPPYAIVQGRVLSDRQASAVAHCWSNPFDGLAAGCVASAGRWCCGFTLSLLSTRLTSRTVPPIVVTRDPAGNGPGTARPARIVCYLPYAKGGHAKHVETGQFAHDAHSIPLEVLMKSVLTMECAPYFVIFFYFFLRGPFLNRVHHT